MEITIDRDYRGEATGTNTGDDFNAEHAVLCGFASLDAEFALNAAKQTGAAFDVTSSTATDLDGPFAIGTESELIVEGGDAVDLARRQVEDFADFNYRFARDEPFVFLHLLQDRDQRIAPGIRVLFNDFFYHAHDFFPFILFFPGKVNCFFQRSGHVKGLNKYPAVGRDVSGGKIQNCLYACVDKELYRCCSSFNWNGNNSR